MLADELLPKCKMLESNSFTAAPLCTVTTKYTYSYNNKNNLLIYQQLY